MFIDKARITVISGTGGNGCASFLRTRTNPRGGPDGGNGGHGGNIILRANANMATLCDLFYQSRYKAASGKHGGNQQKNGARGQDLIINVPIGTLVKEVESGELLCDFVRPDQELHVAKGGNGGFGNIHFKSSTNRAPRQFNHGQEGVELGLNLELKLMADVALVGFPNAGKSTFITGVTRAHSKIASYPFTTRHPILGLLELSDFRTAVIADIPGLIDGAHLNVGLGHAFLRHVERCRMLLFIIDMAGIDLHEPFADYDVLKFELKSFNEELATRNAIVVANKMDRPEAKENLKIFKEHNPGLEVIEISALDGIGLEVLVAKIDEFLTKTKLASHFEIEGQKPDADIDIDLNFDDENIDIKQNVDIDLNFDDETDE